MTLRVFLVAGEPSGDQLGANLIAALRAESGGDVEVAGVGGPLMEGAGLRSVFPMRDLSVMGFLEVAPRIPKILARLARASAAARTFDPDAVVTIDSPDFSFRLQKRLRSQGLAAARIHYVAPSVWAWRPGRARKMAQFLDHVLALLPFEPPYFEKVGLGCSFVGHPAASDEMPFGDGATYRKAAGLTEEKILVSVLFGSRESEVRRHLAPFREAVERLAAKMPPGRWRLACPTVAAVRELVEARTADWPVPVDVFDSQSAAGSQRKRDAFAASRAALAASGTVTVELAREGTPMVVAYRANPVSVWLARRLVSISYASLVNLVLDREAVPERLQEDCQGDILASELGALLFDDTARARQVSDLRAAMARLGAGGPAPSRRAARIVLDLASAKRATGA